MFTGIIEELAEVVNIKQEDSNLHISCKSTISSELKIDQSVAHNGVCLTIVDVKKNIHTVTAIKETLSKTNLGSLKPNGSLNLERCIMPSMRLDGHIVQGHVDAVGNLEERIDDGDWSTCWFQMPPRLASQMASKGSVAVDGVSLTLVAVDEKRFSVALIPHTLQVTTLGQLQPGDPVNLETDVLAKYVQQQLEHRP